MFHSIILTNFLYSHRVPFKKFSVLVSTLLIYWSIRLLELSEPLLNNIRNGTTWCTGHLKTTRVFRVMEQLEEEGYLCLFFSSNRSQVPGLHIASVAYISFFSETVYLLRRLKQITKYYSGEHSAIISSGLLPSISKIILSLVMISWE